MGNGVASEAIWGKCAGRGNGVLNAESDARGSGVAGRDSRPADESMLGIGARMRAGCGLSKANSKVASGRS